MNILKKLEGSLKTLVKEFPVFLAFCVLTGISLTLYSIFDNIYYKNDLEDFFETLTNALAFVTFLNLAFTLLAQRFSHCRWFSVKKVLSLQIVLSCAASFMMYFICSERLTNKYFNLVYFGTILVFLFLSGYVVCCHQKEKTGSSLITSFIAAFGLWFCVSAALCLIFAAFFKLIIPNDDALSALAQASWTATSFFTALPFFVANGTKKYEEINVSKAYKIIFLYALFPLFAVLIVILYAYIIKSLCLLKFPSGLFNPFVSSATCGFIVLSLLLKVFDNKYTKLFYKFGPIVMYPLIAVQLAAFFIRIEAYGFTFARYASLLYIIFSVAAITILLFSNRNPSKNLEKLVFEIFAGVCLFAILPKINLIDVSDASLIHSIEKTYKAHNMYTPEKLITENAEEIFTPEEKSLITTAFYKIKAHKDNISWIVKVPEEKESDKYDVTILRFPSIQEVEKTFNELEQKKSEEKKEVKMVISFEKTFGFEERYSYENNFKSYKDGIKVSSNLNSFNCKGYSTVYPFNNSHCQSEIIVFADELKEEFNLTEELKKHFQGSPLVYDYYKAPEPKQIEIIKGEYKFIFNKCYIYVTDEDEYDYNLSGWILRK